MPDDELITTEGTDIIAPDEMTPARAAFECWYASLAGVQEVTPDAWKGLGEHQALWERVAEACITAYEDPENLGPIARDMEPEELARFRDNR